MIACAVLALAAPPIATPDSLRPDPPAGASQAALQPDAFPSSAATPAPEARVPASAVVPVPKQGAALGNSLEQPQVQQPATTPPAETPTTPVRLPPRVAPLTTTPVIETITTQRHAVARHHAARKARPATPHVQLPATVHGSSHMAIGLITPVAATLPAAGGKRDLVPAALALLALVATSGCLLAVAARYRREGLGV